VPALARLPATQAVAALVLGEDSEPSPDTANRLLSKLEASAMPCFALNDGPIGGTDNQEGSIRLDRKEANELLGAAMSGQLEWELDPDFGYEVAVATPSLTGDRAMALAPRLAYAASGRVYDHAALVPRLKEERHAVLAAIGGLDPAIVAASGWPVEPTGTSWRSLRAGP
jgi:hypothetical protein